jgi:hypothetical protein
MNITGALARPTSVRGRADALDLEVVAATLLRRAVL